MDGAVRWVNSYLYKVLLFVQEHIQQFVSYYNYERYHESLDNLTPADVYYGRGEAILDQREKIKCDTTIST